MSLFATHTLIEALATEWVKHFRRSPFVTLAATTTAITILAVAGSKIDAHEKQKREANRIANSGYSEQLAQIKQLEGSVTQILAFLDQQKKTLENTEDTISRLESERDKLKPLVESDKQVVEAIFRAQEERATAGVWRERLIGFGLGILASLIASFLWYVVVKLAPSPKTNGE